MAVCIQILYKIFFIYSLEMAFSGNNIAVLFYAKPIAYTDIPRVKGSIISKDIFNLVPSSKK